ncbi:unnamed protein product [Closterium sp. NIES-64]|nr:unnamed protein product [Closterium sp. NIES-64]
MSPTRAIHDSITHVPLAPLLQSLSSPLLPCLFAPSLLSISRLSLSPSLPLPPVPPPSPFSTRSSSLPSPAGRGVGCSPFPTRYSPFPTRYSPFPTRCSPFLTRCSAFPTRCSPFPTHYSPFPFSPSPSSPCFSPSFPLTILRRVGRRTEETFLPSRLTRPPSVPPAANVAPFLPLPYSQSPPHPTHSFPSSLPFTFLYAAFPFPSCCFRPSKPPPFPVSRPSVPPLLFPLSNFHPSLFRLSPLSNVCV